LQEDTQSQEARVQRLEAELATQQKAGGANLEDGEEESPDIETLRQQLDYTKWVR
jgi:hypothetical protein